MAEPSARKTVAVGPQELGPEDVKALFEPFGAVEGFALDEEEGVKVANVRAWSSGLQGSPPGVEVDASSTQTPLCTLCRALSRQISIRRPTSRMRGLQQQTVQGVPSDSPTLYEGGGGSIPGRLEIRLTVFEGFDTLGIAFFAMRFFGNPTLVLW